MSTAVRSRHFPRYDRTDGHPFDKNELGVTIALRGTGVLETFARDSIEYVLDAVAGWHAENFVFRVLQRRGWWGCGGGVFSRPPCPAGDGRRPSRRQRAQTRGTPKLPTPPPSGFFFFRS